MISSESELGGTNAGFDAISLPPPEMTESVDSSGPPDGDRLRSCAPPDELLIELEDDETCSASAVVGGAVQEATTSAERRGGRACTTGSQDIGVALTFLDRRAVR